MSSDFGSPCGHRVWQKSTEFDSASIQQTVLDEQCEIITLPVLMAKEENVNSVCVNARIKIRIIMDNIITTQNRRDDERINTVTINTIIRQGLSTTLILKKIDTCNSK